MDNNYLIPERLEDVIRLIIVLAVDKHAFRSEEGVHGRLLEPPKSAKTWLELAQDHPEFFRYKKEEKKDSVTLLIRYIQTIDAQEGELRDRLSIDQTQKLVDQAIALHDKQLARYQRDSFKTVITSAYIGAGTAIAIAVLSLLGSLYSNSVSKSDLEVIKGKLENIESLQRSIFPSTPSVTPTIDAKKEDSSSPTR